MNPDHSISDSAIDEQAALWATRLEENSLSAADQAALEAWSKNPAHSARLEKYLQFSAQLDRQLPELAASVPLLVPAGRRAKAVRFSWFPAVALGAAALVAVGLWLGRPSRNFENFETSVGHRRSLTLRDGTRIDLNSNTSVLVENGRAERRVRMAEGEAYFTVSKDKTRPFIVETPAGSVRVTGTIFDVRTQSSTQIEVTVVEGSVQVHSRDPGEKSSPSGFALTAGDRLSIDPESTSLEALAPQAVADALAWRQGQIVFAGAPLGEALDRFARYHGRTITVAPDAANLRLGGRFSLDDFDGFLSALEEALPVRVTRDPAGSVRVTRRD